jgi:hypothetical protein
MTNLHTRLIPLKHGIEDVRTAQEKFQFVFITHLEKFYFPFESYKPGVYFISSDEEIYSVKDPSFLFTNNLTNKNFF